MGQFLGWLRDLLRDGLDAVGGFLRKLLDDLRESNRYFKMKMALVGGYAAVAVATVVVFIPPGETNEIDARIRMSKTEIIGGRYFLIKNLSSDTWEKLTVTLNDTYTARWPRLRPGKKKAFFFNRFENRQGQAPSQSLRVRTLRIDCSEGVFACKRKKCHFLQSD